MKAFINRCVKHALQQESNPKGVDIDALLKSVKQGKMDSEQVRFWAESLKKTFDEQRDLLFRTLHGLYCDPDSGQPTRINALGLCKKVYNEISDDAVSEIVNRHQEYIAKGDKERQKASRKFFEDLGIVSYLTDAERHNIVSKVCKNLYKVHTSWDNFYNEPPFAERLRNLSEQQGIPASVRPEFVTVVATCAVGNPYGVSKGAFPHYRTMIASFSEAEIADFLKLPKTNLLVAQRINQSPDCRKRYIEMVKEIDPKSVPTQMKRTYRECFEK